jgi:serine/threonine protein kinase
MGEPSPSPDGANAASAAPASGPQNDPLIGRVINDRFRVISLLARGGMGKVYKAEQQPLGRICALKVLNPNYNGEHDPEFHKRFFLEASTSSKLRHPNTVTIFDYGSTDDGVYYMAMELLEGRTLHRLLRENGPLEPARALRIIRQVCRSLREAHSIGVIHRDLKPANIFLCRTEDEEDFVKVLDFGLVKQLDEGGAEHLTQTGLFMGSPKYMAPEQIRGERVSAATDVYALGVVLYEMLAGKVPFDKGNSVNTLMAHVSEALPPLHQINPSVQVPPAIAEFAYRCLAKRAEDRFQTMDALLDGLKLAASGSLGLTSTGEWAPGGSNSLRATGSHLVSAEHSAAPPSGSGQIPAVSPSIHPEHSGVNVTSTPSTAIVAVGAPAATKKRSMVVPALLVVGLLAMVGGAVAIKGSSGATQGANSNNNAGNTTQDRATTTGTGTTNNPSNTATGTGPNTNPNTPTPPAREVHIVLSSEPTNAEVLENGRSLGRTPLELRLTGDDGDPARMHSFVFRLNGFNDASVTLGGSEIRYSARLSRRAVYRPPVRPNVPSGYREW